MLFIARRCSCSCRARSSSGRPRPPPNAPGRISGRVICQAGLPRKMLKALEVDCARVAGDETVALFLLQPGLNIEAILRRDATGTRNFVVVAKVAAISVPVVIGTGVALYDADDTDPVAPQVRVLAAVVGGDAA